MGSPEFAVPALEAVRAAHEVVLVVTQPDKPTGRGQRVQAPAVAEVARKHGLKVLQPTSAKTPEFAQTLRETGAEVAVVVAYGKILPEAVLTAFPHGCLNIHASLLPAYRGAAPIQWCLIRGERETGITIMQLDKGMDTGPMLLKESVEIADDDNAATLAARLAPVGARLILAALEKLERGELSPVKQDDSQASLAPMLKKQDGLLDWTQPSGKVAALARGVDPWPGPTATFGDGTPLKLFGPRLAGEAGEPGTVIAVDARGVVVACGKGAVAFREVQAAGKKRMPAVDFARGGGLSKGMKLGGRA